MQQKLYKYMRLFVIGLCLMLFASKAQASTLPPTLVKTYEFAADKQPFNYSQAPKTIRENDVDYHQTGIEYEILKEMPVLKESSQSFSRELHKEGLSKQNDEIFDDSLTIDENGFTGDIPRTAVRYQTRTENGGSKTITRVVAYPYSMIEPTPDNSIEIKHSGEKITLPLKELKKTGSKWQENVIAKYVINSDDEQYFTLESGRVCSFDLDKPPYRGFEHEILAELRLDPGTHQITGSRWLSGIGGQDGRYTCVAEYTLSRLVSSYTATYEGEAQNPDSTYYDATAVYAGVLYKQEETGNYNYMVKAVVSYEAEPQPSPEPTPEPELEPEPEPIEEEPEKKSGVLGTVIMVLVVAGLSAGGFFLWQKKQAQDEG